jgi:hypothetical protein
MTGMSLVLACNGVTVLSLLLLVVLLVPGKPS